MTLNELLSTLANGVGKSFKKTTLLWILILSTHFSGSQDRANRPMTVSNLNEVNADRIIYGLASFYAQKFNGRMTANGETFSSNQLTAACNVLPLGTWIQVTNLKNGKVIVVRTNDRLHPKTRRIVDLTYSGATKLGFVKNGLTRVKIEILKQNLYKKTASR